MSITTLAAEPSITTDAALIASSVVKFRVIISPLVASVLRTGLFDTIVISAGKTLG